MLQTELRIHDLDGCLVTVTFDCMLELWISCLVPALEAMLFSFDELPLFNYVISCFILIYLYFLCVSGLATPCLFLASSLCDYLILPNVLYLCSVVSPPPCMYRLSCFPLFLTRLLCIPVSRSLQPFFYLCLSACFRSWSDFLALSFV